MTHSNKKNPKTRVSIFAVLEIIMTVIFFSAILFYKFSCIFGTPEYIYIPCSYNEKFDGGLVATEKVEQIRISGCKKLKIAYNALKHCNNLKFFEYTDYEDNILKDLNFLPVNGKLNTIWIGGKVNNWSGLSRCKNLEYITLRDSNFSNFADLEHLSKLKDLDIRSCNQLDYSGIETLNSLDFISYCGDNFDFTGLEKSKSLNSVIVKSENICGYSSIPEINNLEELQLIGLGVNTISTDDLKIISKTKNLKRLELNSCNFEESEVHVRSILKNLTNNNIDVSLNSCNFEVSA